MIIYDLDIDSVGTVPDKTYSILIIYPDTPLFFSITGQFFKTIGRRYSQLINALGVVQHSQFSTSYILDITRQLARHNTTPDFVRFCIQNSTNQDTILYRVTILCNRNLGSLKTKKYPAGVIPAGRFLLGFLGGILIQQP